MYICVHVCKHVYTYIYTYIYIDIYISIYIYIYIHTGTYIYEYVHTHIQFHFFTLNLKNSDKTEVAHTHTYIHIYIYICMYVCIYSHDYIYVHIWIWLSKQTTTPYMTSLQVSDRTLNWEPNIYKYTSLYIHSYIHSRETCIQATRALHIFCKETLHIHKGALYLSQKSSVSLSKEPSKEPCHQSTRSLYIFSKETYVYLFDIHLRIASSIMFTCCIGLFIWSSVWIHLTYI